VKGLGALDLSFILEPPSRAGKQGGISTAIVGTLYSDRCFIAFVRTCGRGFRGVHGEYAPAAAGSLIWSTITAENIGRYPSIIFGRLALSFSLYSWAWVGPYYQEA
jgi:phosphate transport system permease protein